MLVAGGRPSAELRTFGDVPPGRPFWYENSSGLAEIAVNGGSAAATLGLGPGDLVEVAVAGCNGCQGGRPTLVCSRSAWGVAKR